MRLRLFCLSLLVGASPLATAQAQEGLAHAQQGQSPFARDRNVSVAERRRPDFDAPGLHIGPLYVYPKLSADVAFEDNVFASPTNEQSDTIYSVRPSVEASTDWSRHELRGRAAFDTYRFADFSRENNTTYTVDGSGRLDIVRGSSLRGAAGFQHLVEARTTASASQFASEPIEFDHTSASVGGVHEFNRVRVSGDLRVSDYKYDDTRSNLGAPIDLSYRDHTNTEQQLRVDYALSPALAVFGTAIHNDRSYDHPANVGDVKRDSHGWEGGLGADFDLTALARGQFQVGYLSQDYDDSRIGRTKGLAVRGQVEWFPTELTTVTVAAERSVDDTGLVGSAGSLASRASLKVDHELLRNLILSGRVNWTKDDFRGLDRVDTQRGVMLGVNYLLSRRVGVFTSYNFLSRKSEGLQRGTEFNTNRIQAGLVLQY